MSQDRPGKKDSHYEGMLHTQGVHTNEFHWSCWSSPPRSLHTGSETALPSTAQLLAQPSMDTAFCPALGTLVPSLPVCPGFIEI